MKSLNQMIKEYTACLHRNEIQVAYRAILEFIGELRSDMIKRYPDYKISNIYQGYMDMSYFSVRTNLFEDKGLKIAIVYLHEKGTFEVWLSARNREILTEYKSVFNGIVIDNIPIFHDENNHDSLIEYTLTDTPDFEDKVFLLDVIEQGVAKFINSITELVL